jgi:hypothetical protein
LPLSNYATLALVAAGAWGAALDELLALLVAASRDDLAKLIAARSPTTPDPVGRSSHSRAASGTTTRCLEAGVQGDYRRGVECFKAEVCAVDFSS